MAGHIDTTKKFFSAWARQDHAAVLELVHDDVVYQNMPLPTSCVAKRPLPHS